MDSNKKGIVIFKSNTNYNLNIISVLLTLQDNTMSGFRFPGFSSGYGDSDDGTSTLMQTMDRMLITNNTIKFYNSSKMHPKMILKKHT